MKKPGIIEESIPGLETRANAPMVVVGRRRGVPQDRSRGGNAMSAWDERGPAYAGLVLFDRVRSSRSSRWSPGRFEAPRQEHRHDVGR